MEMPRNSHWRVAQASDEEVVNGLTMEDIPLEDKEKVSSLDPRDWTQLNEQMAQLTEIVLSAAGANKGTTMPRPTTPLATRFETLFKAKKAMEMENEYNDMIARHAPHLLK